MQLARVLGTVVSTQKDPSLTGQKFLLLQFVDQTGQALPGYEVAADCVGAGVDEWVLVSRGSAARQTDRNQGCPVDALVVAIVDTVAVNQQMLYSKYQSR